MERDAAVATRDEASRRKQKKARSMHDAPGRKFRPKQKKARSMDDES